MKLKININNQTINKVHITKECMQDFINYINKKNYSLDELDFLPMSTKLKTKKFKWNLETQIDFLKCPLRRKWLGYLWEKEVLENINLEGTDLSYLDLSEANLENANLTRVCLDGANLSNSNLIGASLYCSELSWTNLKDANLYGCDLSFTNLEEVTSLEGVNLIKTRLTGTNLSSVKGLFSFTSSQHLFLVHKSEAYISSPSNIYVKIGCMGHFLEVWQDGEYRNGIGKINGYSQDEVDSYYKIIMTFAKLLA